MAQFSVQALNVSLMLSVEINWYSVRILRLVLSPLGTDKMP